VSSLTGQLLVAMPQMQDPRFARSVVYLCAHSAEGGAIGLVINKTIGSLTIDELYTHLKIEAVRSNHPQPVHFGGPVDTARGFVLHSADYREEGTLGIDDDFAMTTTLDILRAIGKGGGPRQSILALGYAGWAPGQLDAEIQSNGWLSVPADIDLVFDEADGKWQGTFMPSAVPGIGVDDTKWHRALAKLGVSPSMLSAEAGHA
jgi:putative transcriptional regulator